MATSDFADRIHAIYDRQTPCIYPFIGETFRDPTALDLRVMAVGINAYSCGDDWGRQAPGLYADWFEKQTYRFQKGVLRDLTALGTELTRTPFLFAGQTFRGIPSFFVTNAVKVYMRATEGKRASQLTADKYAAHINQWRDELDEMAKANVLPHVLAIVGAPFWAAACGSFRSDVKYTNFSVTSYQPVKGPCLHHVNRIGVESASGHHDLLLVRVRHPASRGRNGGPRWLMAQSDFREIAASASTSNLRVRVLEVGAEGGSCEVDADFDGGRPVAFYVWEGGPTDWEDANEEASPRVARGPMSWDELLEASLGPNRWLEHVPCFVHPAMAPLVRAQPPAESAEARARWAKALLELAPGLTSTGH